MNVIMVLIYVVFFESYGLSGLFLLEMGIGLFFGFFKDDRLCFDIGIKCVINFFVLFIEIIEY